MFQTTNQICFGGKIIEKKHVDFPAFPCDKQPYHLTRIAGQGQLSLEISLVLDIS